MAPTLGYLGKTAPAAERRQLTVMFCDLVGSTALSERFDPEDMRELLTMYRQVCASAIHRFGGFVAQYVGDGIFIYFGYPQAHEYAAEHAVRAALEIVKDLSELNGTKLEVRIGIATGTVVVGDIVGEHTEQHHAVVGRAPNLASRLTGIAQPGEIVVSENTQNLLLGVFELRNLGAMNLKGFTESVNAWQIMGESGVRSHSHAIYDRTNLTPLIARADEVNRLNRCWSEAKAGKGQVVLISGEAGIGKSRLARHFERQLALGGEDFSVCKLYCSENYKNSTLHPIINEITHKSGLSNTDSRDQSLKKVHALFGESQKIDDVELEIILDFLSIDIHRTAEASHLTPDERKSKTFDILEEFICSEARTRPSLLIIEDLHWSDPTTLELLDRIVLKRVSELPILVLLTFRPEFQPHWPDEHYITDIKVKRLSPEDSERFLAEMAITPQLPPGVIKKIIERSDRIPLFLEEVFKATNENIALSSKAGRSDVDRSISGTEVPNSLAGSLMERLDRLGAVKGVAQVAAAIGNAFSSEILADVADLGHAELHEALDQLILSDVIHPRTMVADTTYVFKHALLKDAAYSSLLRGERKRLHAAIARKIEEKHPETAEREPELLAYHCSEGGIAEQAIDYWQRAGERARERSANSEAIGHISSGLDLLNTLSVGHLNVEREIDLRTSLALALTALHGGGAPEVKEHYSRARVLSQLDSDNPKHFTVMMGSWLNSFIGGDFHDADKLSNELLDLAKQKEDAAYLVEAKRVRGMTLFCLGNFAEARSSMESALKLHHPEDHRQHAVRFGLDPRVCCEAYLAQAFLFLGNADDALLRSEHAVRAAEALDHPYTHAFSLAFAAIIRQNLERHEETCALAAKAIQVADENEFQFFAKQQLVVKIWSEAQTNGKDVALLEMREALDEFLASGSTIGSTRMLSLMAEVYIRSGQADEAEALLEKALHAAHNSGEQIYLAELHRLQAELCLVRTDNPAVAEVCGHLGRSLSVSEEQKAIFWQLKAAKSVAEFCQNLGQHTSEANQLLSLCQSVREGGDAQQLAICARDLLDKLNP